MGLELLWEWLRVACHLLVSEIPKGGISVSYLCKKEENSNLIDFQTDATAHSFSPNLEKKANFATTVLYPGSNTSCVSAVSKKFTDRPRLSGSLIERKHDGKDVWVLVSLSL